MSVDYDPKIVVGVFCEDSQEAFTTLLNAGWDLSGVHPEILEECLDGSEVEIGWFPVSYWTDCGGFLGKELSTDNLLKLDIDFVTDKVKEHLALDSVGIHSFVQVS